MAQRKLKSEHLMQFFKLLTGEDVELVGDDSADEISFEQDALLQLVDASREPVISQKIKSELESSIHGSVSGKISAAMRKSLAETTGVDVKALEGKDAKEAAKIAFEHYAKSLGVDKETAAQQLQEVMQNHANELNTLRQTHEQERAAFKMQIDDFSVDSILGNLYANAKGIPDTLDRTILQGDFKNWLRSQYNVEVSEDKKGLKLYDRNNPDKLALNAAGTELLRLEDIHMDYHKKRGQIHEDNRHVNPADTLPKITDTKVINGKPMSVGQQVNEAMMTKLGVG